MLKHVKVSPNSTFKPMEISSRVVKATITGTKTVADMIRDDMRKEYNKQIHRTAYGRVAVVSPTSPASLSTSAIVTRREGDLFYVGPKKGGIRMESLKGGATTQSYDEIFGYIEFGTGDMGRGTGRGWWFRLPSAGGRQGASSDGAWYTKGQAPKPFIETTVQANKSGGFAVKVDREIRPLISEAVDR